MAKLATLGLSNEQAEAVAGMLCEVEEATATQAEAVIERSRAKTRERVQRWRDNHQSNVTERSETSPNVKTRLTRRPAHVEDKSLNTEIEPQVKVESKSPAKPSPRQRLEAVVDGERAEALLDHRQRLRKPLTEHAAKMLATELAKFPDPNAAADRMIAKGWVSTDVTWPEAHSSQPRAGPVKAKGSGIGGVFDQLDGYFDGKGNGGGDDQAPQGVVLSLPHRAA